MEPPPLHHLLTILSLILLRLRVALYKRNRNRIQPLKTCPKQTPHTSIAFPRRAHIFCFRHEPATSSFPHTKTHLHNPHVFPMDAHPHGLNIPTFRIAPSGRFPFQVSGSTWMTTLLFAVVSEPRPLYRVDRSMVME